MLHSVWWEPLLSMAPTDLSTKRIVCHMSGEPFRYLCSASHRHVVSAVDCWIAQTRQATRQCAAIGLPHTYIPYTTDVESFYRLPVANEGIQALRREWKIPDRRYLIGSFHRDSAGFDLSIPKKVKGPDILAEIALALHRRGVPCILCWPGRAGTDQAAPRSMEGPLYLCRRNHVGRRLLQEHAAPQDRESPLQPARSTLSPAGLEGGPRSPWRRRRRNARSSAHELGWPTICWIRPASMRPRSRRSR